jgi:hypothetical protein
LIIITQLFAPIRFNDRVYASTFTMNGECPDDDGIVNIAECSTAGLAVGGVERLHHAEGGVVAVTADHLPCGCMVYTGGDNATYWKDPTYGNCRPNNDFKSVCAIVREGPGPELFPFTPGCKGTNTAACTLQQYTFPYEVSTSDHSTFQYSEGEGASCPNGKEVEHERECREAGLQVGGIIETDEGVTTVEEAAERANFPCDCSLDQDIVRWNGNKGYDDAMAQLQREKKDIQAQLNNKDPTPDEDLVKSLRAELEKNENTKIPSCSDYEKTDAAKVLCKDKERSEVERDVHGKLIRNDIPSFFYKTHQDIKEELAQCLKSVDEDGIIEDCGDEEKKPKDWNYWRCLMEEIGEAQVECYGDALDVISQSLENVFGAKTSTGFICGIKEVIVEEGGGGADRMPGTCCLDAPYQLDGEKWGRSVSAFVMGVVPEISKPKKSRNSRNISSFFLALLVQL